MKTDQSLLEFNPKLPNLSKNEEGVLKLLIEATKLITPIYELQVNHLGKDLGKDEFEMESKKNPEMLLPFVSVEKINGKIIVIPYHIKYAHLLMPVAEKLEQAAKLSDNKKFANALRVQAETLLKGNYEKSIATWLRMEPYILDISIGPLQYHSANLHSNKASYQAWVGVLDKEGTGKLNRYKKIIHSIRRKVYISKDHISNLDHVKAKTIDVLIFSGFMARTKFIGVNLPMNINLIEKYGSEITIFNQPNDLRLKEQILPVYENIFPKSFKQGFESEDLRRGYLRVIAMHELAHSFLYYKNAHKNLEDLFICIYELAASILGIRMAGGLMLADVINNKQLESMIVTYMCRCLYLVEKGKTDKIMTNHTVGAKIFINHLMENGALRLQGKTAVPNFMKIFLSLHELSYKLEDLLYSGIKKDAEEFIKKYTK